MPLSKRAANRASKASKTRKPEREREADSREPEVLGEDAPRPRRETKAGALDELAGFLAAQERPIVVAYAVAEVYGGKWTPDRELAVLKLLKADKRFVITDDAGKNHVALAAAADAASTKQSLDQAKSAAADEPPKQSLDKILDRIDEVLGEKPAKTLGEHLKDAQGRPLRIPWPHDVGSHVLLMTDGHPPKRATIRNIKNSGNSNVAVYDLNTENGGQTNDVPAYRIGRDLEADGELSRLRERLAMEKRHRERGKHLADLYASMQATEKNLAEELKEHRASMAETADKLSAHARTDPGQQDLRDLVGDGSAPATDNAKPRQARKDAKPSSAEDKLADAPAKTEPGVVTLEKTGLTLDELMAARFEQGTASTGKPQQVKPVKIAGDDRLVVDVQNGRAVALLVVSKKGWSAMAPKYGEPLALPSSTQPAKLAAGGRWCGVPVKIGRATSYLGATEHAVFVQLPAEPEKPTGKEAAAGA